MVCFTAAQIPGIENRTFPKELAGKLYPRGIRIFPESKLPELIKKFKADEVILAYSDLSHQKVMEKASLVLSCGADFRLLGPKSTMLESRKPVISVCAVRTGAGKSPTTSKIVRKIKKTGLKPVVIRHAMPYGNLKKQAVQRFATHKDLKRHRCTIEELEEYLPHIEQETVVYAGVDYRKILKEAEEESNVIVFDGGNNDLSFYRPDLLIVVTDSRRPGHEVSYYPGMANFLMADVIIVNKVKTAKKIDIKTILGNIKRYNPKAKVILADMQKKAENPGMIKGKTILAVGDGPTLTHGGLSYGAAFLVAKQYKAKRIIDPKSYAVGSIKQIYEKYPHLGHSLPAMGYSKKQIKELEKTINRTPCDLVIDGSPANLGKYIRINKPIINVIYELQEIGRPNLEQIVRRFLKKTN